MQLLAPTKATSTFRQQPLLLPSSVYWGISQLDRFGTLKAALVLALLSVAACTRDVAVMREVKQQCQARGLDTTSAAYDACVHEVSEALSVGWDGPAAWATTISLIHRSDGRLSAKSPWPGNPLAREWWAKHGKK